MPAFLKLQYSLLDHHQKVHEEAYSSYFLFLSPPKLTNTSLTLSLKPGVLLTSSMLIPAPAEKTNV